MYCFLGCFKTDSGNRRASAQGGQTAEEQHAANRGSSHSLLLGRGEGGDLVRVLGEVCFWLMRGELWQWVSPAIMSCILLGSMHNLYSFKLPGLCNKMSAGHCGGKSERVAFLPYQQWCMKI